MIDVNNLLETFKQIDNLSTNNNLFSKKCREIAEAICHKKTTIRDVVTELGYFLVHTSPDKREKGTLILSEILNILPFDFLSSVELNFISTFYADRLKDHHQVIPAILKGILAVSRMKNLPKESPCQLLNSLFNNVPCQQQQLKDRQYIYYIIMEFFKNNLIELQAMGFDFVLGVISAIDGERDPRNLLMLFDWLPQVLRSVKLGHLTEEMFDVISCYFPVDFRAPSQDPQMNVGREDLSKALCPCLCAVPEFAVFCIPLLLEKLFSSLRIAKLDSINLLAESCKIFDIVIYEQHSEEILSSLQKEILNASDPELEHTSLLAMTAVIGCIAKGGNKSLFRQTFNNLYDTIKGNLRPDTKLFIPSSKILLSVAKASMESCDEIIKLIVPLLINQYNINSDVTHQEILFKTLLMFVLVHINMYDNKNIMENDALSEIPTLCLESMMHRAPEIRIAGLEYTALILKSLPLNIRENLYELLKNKIIQQEPTAVRHAVLSCFKTVAIEYGNEVLEKVIFSNTNVADNNITLQLYLEALCVIVTEEAFTSELLPLLLNYCLNDNLPTAIVSIRCLRKLVEENCHNNNIQDFLYTKFEIVKKGIDWIVTFIKDNNELNNASVDDVATIIKHVIGHQKSDVQEDIVNTCLPVLLNYYNSDDQLRDGIIIIFEGFLSKLRRDVEIPNKYQLMKNIVSYSTSRQNSTYLYICKLTANIVNKSMEDEYLHNFLKEIDKYTAQIVYYNCTYNKKTENAILLISWITKALVIKDSTKANEWTDKLISILDAHEQTAKSFKLIMDDSFDCLNTNSYCNIRFLYRQKFFIYVSQKLSERYKEDKPNYLIAVGYLLQLAPQQVIMMCFKKILRLLIFCLEICKDTEALCAVLETLRKLIEIKEPQLENHIDDLLPRFLNLTKFKLSMKVRIAAIKCIQEFSTGYPMYKLLPHKQMIIFGMESCLDDKKRLVRKQAVETRSCWFLLDAAT